MEAAMHVYWLEQTVADIPNKNDWLSGSELAYLGGLCFLKRRADWRLGRWTAKRALISYLKLPCHPSVLAKIEIRSASSGEPEVFINGNPARVAISLSHSAGRALCAVMPEGVNLGCDLELIEPRSAAFLADYFTVEERDLVGCAPATELDPLSTLLWSGKESALKALHAGLRLATSEVVVSPGNISIGPDRWSRMQVRHIDGRLFYGWWQHDDNFVRTLVADCQPDCPIPLGLGDSGEGTRLCA